MQSICHKDKLVGEYIEICEIYYVRVRRQMIDNGRFINSLLTKIIRFFPYISNLDRYILAIITILCKSHRSIYTLAEYRTNFVMILHRLLILVIDINLLKLLKSFASYYRLTLSEVTFFVILCYQVITKYHLGVHCQFI